MVLADDPTIPNDDLILQEIDNYLEGIAADEGEVKDSEKTISELQHHIFTVMNYAFVTSGHGVKSSSMKGTLDCFPSKISKRAMEKAFVEAEINGDHFHCILLEPSFTANNPPPRHVAVYTRCLTYSQPITFHPFEKRFCHLHNISLAQLVPNFWIIFIGIWILWHKHFQRDLTMDEFLYVHSLCKSTQFEGWQYLGVYSRSKIEKAITLVE